MAYVYKPYVKKEYQQSQGVQDAQAALQQHQQTKPGSYESKYQQQIDALYGKITDRPKFHYDINEDALYQSMAQRYQQQGKQAMMDTMGQAAALTGGYGSSYGQSVGQQTYQGYLQALADLVPDYYQMALNAYNAEGDQLYKQYAMAMEQEGQDYNRWQDRNNAYLQELSRLQGVYESERNFDYGKWQQDQSFDYGMWKDDQDSRYQQDRDALSDQRYDQEWKYQQERDRVADEQWLKQFQESQRQYNESMAWQREQAAAAAAAAAAKRSGGGGGGSSRKSGSSESGSSGGGVSGILSLGRGPVSMDTLASLVAKGEVAAEKKGNTVYVSNTGKKSNGNSYSVVSSSYPKYDISSIFKKKK